MICNPKKYNAKDHQQVQTTKAVVSFIAGNLLPLSTVDSPHFHDLMETLNPRYQVPSRKHLSTKLLPEKKAEIQEKVKISLQKAEMICVTVDLWSSRQMKSYFGITAHYITDWCLQSVMLACSRFRGSHTGDAIYEEYEKIMALFQISNKVSFIISDSASNMTKAFSLPGFEEYDDNLEDESDDDSGEEDNRESVEELEDYYSELNQHVPCFAYVLQLVIKDGFKQAASINKALNKASSIVSHVRKSIHSSEILESEKRLKAANGTRWNSQLKMIRSVLRIPKEKLESLDTHILTAYERKILEDLVEILTPFETATHCIQGDKVVTSSMVVPCVRVLKSTIDSLSHKYSSRFVATLKHQLMIDFPSMKTLMHF